jgi:hypothetical protein
MAPKKVANRHTLLHLIDKVKQKVTDQEYKDIVEELAKTPTEDRYVEVEYVQITPTRSHPSSDVECQILLNRQKRVYRVVKEYTSNSEWCNYGDKQTEITESLLSVLEDIIPANKCFIRERRFDDDVEEVAEACIYLSVKRLN